MSASYGLVRLSSAAQDNESLQMALCLRSWSLRDRQQDLTNHLILRRAFAEICKLCYKNMFASND